MSGGPAAGSARERMIVALDLADVPAAAAMVERLGDTVTFYKIGMELTYAGGLRWCGIWSRAAGRSSSTSNCTTSRILWRLLRRASRISARPTSPSHAYPQTMAAAHRGRQGSGLKILGVTVLTSMADADLAAAGYRGTVGDIVAQRAKQAGEAGIDGIICSAADIEGVRRHIGDALEIITPGIRPAGSAVGDQKRVMTPGEAIRAGASRLVIGRPVTEAVDPRAAAEAIIAEIAGA